MGILGFLIFRLDPCDLALPIEDVHHELLFRICARNRPIFLEREMATFHQDIFRAQRLDRFREMDQILLIMKVLDGFARIRQKEFCFWHIRREDGSVGKKQFSKLADGSLREQLGATC